MVLRVVAFRLLQAVVDMVGRHKVVPLQVVAASVRLQAVADMAVHRKALHQAVADMAVHRKALHQAAASALLRVADMADLLKVVSADLLAFRKAAAGVTTSTPRLRSSSAFSQHAAAGADSRSPRVSASEPSSSRFRPRA